MGLHERWFICYPWRCGVGNSSILKGMRDRMIFNGAFNSEILMILYLNSQISCACFKISHTHWLLRSRYNPERQSTTNYKGKTYWDRVKRSILKTPFWNLKCVLLVKPQIHEFLNQSDKPKLFCSPFITRITIWKQNLHEYLFIKAASNRGEQT